MALEIIILILGIIIGAYLGYKFAKSMLSTNIQKQVDAQIALERKDAIKRSRAVLGGQLIEQLAPYFPDFPYSPSEARFVGKPVDLLVFKGMDEKCIDEVVFVEVKTGKSALSATEKSLKDAIENKRVSWCEYRIENKEVEILSCNACGNVLEKETAVCPHCGVRLQ
jgi:predicted Holliday junction resolvase-like endonuclease